MRGRAILAFTLALSACTQTPHPQFASFEKVLAATPSATRALGQWCASQHIATPAQITATNIGDGSAIPPPPSDLGKLLTLRHGELSIYRHVALKCGPVTLSIAHNWYNPALLTAEMNTALTTTNTPFGTVTTPLNFTRENLGSVHGASPQCPAHTILSHRALLRLPDKRPLALLIECYTAANLKP
jgi:hypothetical protein